MSDENALRSAFNFVLDHCTPPVQNGAHLLRHVQKVTRFLPFGCKPIDDMLQGGLREGQILELYGESSSGKTQLCMLATAQTALRGEKVVYIDTSNSFSGRRIAFMLGQNVSNSVAETAFENITVIKAYTAHDIIHRLTRIMHAECEKQRATRTLSTTETDNRQPDRGETESAVSAERKGSLSLIVLDSLGAIISPILGGGQHTQGHAVLAALASLLKEIAVSYDIAVLVTNHLVSGGGRAAAAAQSNAGNSVQWTQEKKAALGESWQHQAHVRVQLEIDRTSNNDTTQPALRIAVLKKSTTQATSGSSSTHSCHISLRNLHT